MVITFSLDTAPTNAYGQSHDREAFTSPHDAAILTKLRPADRDMISETAILSEALHLQTGPATSAKSALPLICEVE